MKRRFLLHEANISHLAFSFEFTLLNQNLNHSVASSSPLFNWTLLRWSASFSSLERAQQRKMQIEVFDLRFLLWNVWNFANFNTVSALTGCGHEDEGEKCSQTLRWRRKGKFQFFVESGVFYAIDKFHNFFIYLSMTWRHLVVDVIDIRG